MKGRVRLMKKMARSASLSAADRFMMNCTYLDAAQKVGALFFGIRERSVRFRSCHTAPREFCTSGRCPIF